MNDVITSKTELAIRKIVSKIEEERLTTNFNFESFAKRNSSLEKFLINYQMQNSFISLDITETNYQTILQYLKKIYTPKNKLNTRKKYNLTIINLTLKKYFKTLTKKYTIDTLIDSLTLAFIAGSVYGLGIISIYSKIVSTIN